MHAIVLGIIQGLTEFLPVSSSAHLILAPYFLHWDDPGLAFDVALHMGTLAAILAFYWRDWSDLLKQIPKTLELFLKRDWHTLNRGVGHDEASLWQLVMATIPGGIIGYLLEKHAEETFRNPMLIGITLAVFGTLLGIADRKGGKARSVGGMTLKDALIIGTAQALAVIPGVSRSGITITAGLLMGLSRPAATRFSFLLAAPIIAGAGLLKSRYILHTILGGGPEAIAVGLGFAASLVFGLLAVGILSLIAKSRTFAGFVVYRVVLGVGVVLYLALS